MKPFAFLFLIFIGPMTALAQNEINYAIQDSKCTGILQKDGSIVYQGNCPKTRKTVSKKELKKGDILNSIDGQEIDSPQKAMELYNKTKDDEATSISVDRTTDQDSAEK